MTYLKVVTIGVYGTTEASFYQALVQAGVDTFCDIRQRRGMRGSTYAYVNSQYLQKRLGNLDIVYHHLKDLAPSPSIRDRQKAADSAAGEAKRTRTSLGAEFIQAYEAECLGQFDAQQFIATLGPETKCIALFCVEREPEACHRSLVAKRLAQALEIIVEDITP